VATTKGELDDQIMGNQIAGGSRIGGGVVCISCFVWLFQ
jgi:hypothetical protein